MVKQTFTFNKIDGFHEIKKVIKYFGYIKIYTYTCHK